MKVNSLFKNIFFLFIFLSYFIIGKAQNLVPNSSFETPKQPNVYASSASKLELLAHWKEFNSSDWFYKGYFEGRYDVSGNTNGQSGPGTLIAHSGNGYIGFGSCEGAQVKLINKIIPKV
jgi:hypothetical protein